MNLKSLALVAPVVAFLSACGGGSSTQSPPPAHVPISVVLSTPPPSQIDPNKSAAIAATVSNDSANAGVNWSCTPTNECGDFAPDSTPSGDSTTYTAPSSAPSGGTITIVAASVTDGSKRASATTQISNPASNVPLNGHFVFSVTSPTGNRGTTSLVGSVILDGDGNVTGGVVDIVSPSLLDVDDQILSTSSTAAPLTSSYALDSSGRGSMRIQTANGQTLDFSLALTSATHALIAEVDGNPGSGTLDLQQRPSGGFAASQISGGYSFTMTGIDAANSATKVTFGGVFSADGSTMLDDGTLDINTAGVMSTASFFGHFSAPDSNGRGTLDLNLGRTLTYYLISPKALRILEADNINLMGGSAFAQGGSVIFIGSDCFYQHSGWSSAGLTITAGHFNIPEGDNVIDGGISDSNAGGSPTTPRLAAAVSGHYDSSSPFTTGTINIADAAGHSTFNLYVVDRNVDTLDPSNSKAGFFDGGGNALLMHTDANIIGTGFLYQKTETNFPVFSADQAVQLTNSVTTPSATNELDLTGLLTSDGSANFTHGLVDYDQNDSSSPVAVLAASITGTFAADAVNPGRLTGTLTISTPNGAYPFISPSAATFNVSYYQMDASQTYVMQTNSSANSAGYVMRQLLP